ncbi:hypothetical protein VUR80DRAFT_4979 [Thermomyces stellatus]
MLPGRRRLQQGTRPSAPPPADDVAELPTYLPQACPLNPEAIAAIRALNQNLGTSKLDTHIKDALTHLSASTSALNSTLQSSRYEVDNISEKKEAEKVRLQKAVEELEETTKALTGDAEEAVRELVDLKGEIEDEKGAFGQAMTVSSEAVQNRERERAEKLRERRERAEIDGEAEDANGADDEDPLGDEEGEVQALSDLIKDLKEHRAANYREMTMYQRYALNNDYADFRRQWHNGLHGEDAVLPDAKRWFSQEGHPIFNFGRSQGGGDEDNVDGDTDLIVERATVSTRCPLSLQEMSEPFANRRCKHVFEKAAIMEYIGRQGRVTCPQAGCQVVFTKRDFYLDQAMLARIRRKQSRRETGGEGEEDEDEDEGMDDEGEDEGGEEEGEGRVEAEPEPPRSASSRHSIKRERLDVDV